MKKPGEPVWARKMLTRIGAWRRHWPLDLQLYRRRGDVNINAEIARRHPRKIR